MDLQLYEGYREGYDSHDPLTREPRICTEQAQKFYSQQLQNLIAQCVRYQPADMIDLATLLGDILWLTTGVHGLSNGHACSARNSEEARRTLENGRA